MGKATEPPRGLWVLLLLVGLVLLWYLWAFFGQGSSIDTTRIPFKGIAKGGSLVLANATDPHFSYAESVSITTIAGETAESVVARFARGVAQGNTLKIQGRIGRYLLAGTETGLGIPKAPLFLSCSCEKRPGELPITWVNPQGKPKYDRILVTWRYRTPSNRQAEEGGRTFLPGTATSFVVQKSQGPDCGNLDVWLLGLCLGRPQSTTATPSNLVSIHVIDDGCCQEDADGVPFTGGVAPNWVPWSTEREPNRAAFEQGDKYAGFDAQSTDYQAKTLLTKPYFQVMKAPPKGQAHGVYRKFLGLTPGHTYRLTACLSTMDMDSAKGDWSFSVHGTPTRGEALPLEPLAEKVASIASFGPGRTTHGKFDFVISGYTRLAEGSVSQNVTLPADACAIAVWVRFRCDDPAGRVGLAGVRLEDLTTIKNPKSPERVVQEEAAMEAEMLDRVKTTAAPQHSLTSEGS
jgi:hypothetical protein